MQDLVVCVGESCHLNGAEIVVKSFKELISQNKLEDRVSLKGSFCIGECCESREVSARFGGKVFTVDPENCAQAFANEVLPATRPAEEA